MKEKLLIAKRFDIKKVENGYIVKATYYSKGGNDSAEMIYVAYTTKEVEELLTKNIKI